MRGPEAPVILTCYSLNAGPNTQVTDVEIPLSHAMYSIYNTALSLFWHPDKARSLWHPDKARSP
jgi:hypothetical protein